MTDQEQNEPLDDQDRATDDVRDGDQAGDQVDADDDVQEALIDTHVAESEADAPPAEDPDPVA